MGDDLIVTVIATGFEREDQPAAGRRGRRHAAGYRASRSSRCWRGVRSGRMRNGRIKTSTVRPSCGGWASQREAMERMRSSADDEWDVPTFYGSRPTESHQVIEGEVGTR